LALGQVDPEIWFAGNLPGVKTTLDLPDELMRTVKMRAVEQDRRLKDVIADLLRRGLADEARPADRARRRVELPLVRCAHPAAPDEEMTPERVADVLAGEEAESASARSSR
jgi:plasmid stability protein